MQVCVDIFTSYIFNYFIIKEIKVSNLREKFSGSKQASQFEISRIFFLGFKTILKYKVN